LKKAKSEANDSQSVSAFIQKLEPDLAKLVEAIRSLILGTSKEIGEHIKWNSPSFFYSGEMKPFNPKEYKRDLLVMNLRKGTALLVFPTGASITAHSEILEGDYPDGRRTITFRTLEEVKAKSDELQRVVHLWLGQIEK